MANNSVFEEVTSQDYDFGDTPVVSAPEEKKEEAGDFNWEASKSVEEDSLMAATFRWLWQPASGRLHLTPPGILADVWQAWGTGESLAELDYLEENIPRLKELFPQAWPEDFELDKEAYLRTLDDASSTIPTVSNIERGVEALTGLPLEAKTRGQRLLRLAGSGSQITPGSVGSKAAGSVLAPSASAGLEALGVPEPLADILGLGAAALGGGALAGAVDRTAQGARNLYNRPTPAQIEAEAVAGRPPPGPGGPGGPPPDLPPTKFGTAGEILESLSAEEQAEINQIISSPPQEPLGGIRPEAPEVARSSTLPPITEGGEELGIRVATPPAVKSPEGLRNRVVNAVSENEIYNVETAGKGLQKEVRTLDAEAYSNVNDLYATSRKLNEAVNEIHPDLVSSLMERATDIRSIPKPSSVESQHLNSLDRIIASLAEIDTKGNITGYKPINSQTMIDQIQSLRQIVDYDFAHGSPKNVFKPTINDIQDSLIQVSQQTGNAKAAEALIDAQTGYREWSEKFNNDYINPYRDLTNRDYRKLYKKIEDPDNFNVMRDLIGETPDGAKLISSAQREIVDKQLKNILKDPRNIDKGDLNRAYRELETVISPKQIDGIKKEISDARERFPNKVRVINRPEKITPDYKSIQKYTNKTREQIESMMNTRSGIKELQADTSKTPAGTEQFNKFKQEKVQEILRGEKIKPDYSGDDLYNVMNNKKNYDLMEELTSPEETKALFDATEKVSNRKFTSENVKKFSRELFKYKILKIALSV